MVKFLHRKPTKIWLITILAISCILFIALRPQLFVDLWLTKDQQGQILFDKGYYKQANETFDSSLWQAYSAYANEDYEKAAALFSQYNNANALMAQANALAHGRNYLKARNLYQYILNTDPSYKDAKVNIKIVQAIIDDVNFFSQSQQPEQGVSSNELGEEPQTADGAEQKDGKPQETEQLSSKQLLLDDNLNEMWLRQVQKDPAQFLSQKFYMQLERSNTNNSTDGMETKDEQ